MEEFMNIFRLALHWSSSAFGFRSLQGCADDPQITRKAMSAAASSERPRSGSVRAECSSVPWKFFDSSESWAGLLQCPADY